MVVFACWKGITSENKQGELLGSGNIIGRKSPENKRKTCKNSSR
jgi:hypothetical protein